MDPSSPFYVLAGQQSNPGQQTPVLAQFLAYGEGGWVIDPNPQSNPLQQIYQYNSAGQLIAVQNANPENYLIVPIEKHFELMV
jgi:hypothetical protein